MLQNEAFVRKNTSDSYQDWTYCQATSPPGPALRTLKEFSQLFIEAFTAISQLFIRAFKDPSQTFCRHCQGLLEILKSSFIALLKMFHNFSPILSKTFSRAFIGPSQGVLKALSGYFQGLLFIALQTSYPTSPFSMKATNFNLLSSTTRYDANRDVQRSPISDVYRAF